MLDRDHYLTPDEAIKQGIIDQVLTKRPSAGAATSSGEGEGGGHGERANAP